MDLEQFQQHLFAMLHRAGWQTAPVLADVEGARDWLVTWPRPYLTARLRFALHWQALPPLSHDWVVLTSTDPLVAVALLGVANWEWPQPGPGDDEAQEVLTALTIWRLQKTTPTGCHKERALETASTPEDVFAVLAHHLSERQRRLFTCACLRRLEIVRADERNLRAVVLTERYADGEVPKREMKKARKAARLPFLTSFDEREEVAQVLAYTRLLKAGGDAPYLLPLAWDIAGYPWRPVNLRWAWLQQQDRAARRLADAIYAEARWEELPVLGDALEEAGCTDARILDHCRLPGEHGRGCWLVDAVRRA